MTAKPKIARIRVHVTCKKCQGWGYLNIHSGLWVSHKVCEYCTGQGKWTIDNITSPYVWFRSNLPSNSFSIKRIKGLSYPHD